MTKRIVYMAEKYLVTDRGLRSVSVNVAPSGSSRGNTWVRRSNEMDAILARWGWERPGFRSSNPDIHRMGLARDG